MWDSALEAEVVELARSLIRLDTSNPPGRETPAAELLASYLREAGADCELMGPDPDRQNLVARVAGSGDGPSLMLMAHTDVVPAPDAGWTVPPFAGEVRDGHLLGRGAVDMKGELSARAVALAALARGEWRPAGDVVLLAEADEERNTADVGMTWLVRERPDVRCDYAINEGGGQLIELANGRRVVTVSVGEKRITSLRIRVRGRAGHASLPAGADNAVGHAATAVERLLAHEAQARIIPSVRRALEVLGAPHEPDAVAAWGAEQHPLLAQQLPAMTRMTVTPTGLRTDEPPNVIPPFADVICDVRALPGETEADIRDQIDGALGPDLSYEVELLERIDGGTESPLDTPLYEACADYVAERVPGAVLLPLISPGFSDSYWVREAHGTVAYGFAPVFATEHGTYVDGIHGADEAIALADLAEMVRFHLHAIRALSAP